MAPIDERKSSTDMQIPSRENIFKEKNIETIGN